MPDTSSSLLLLSSYATGRPHRGVVGASRYAQRLREDLIAAAEDQHNRTLMIRGEPGLGKDNLAALVHFGSSQRRKLLIRLGPTDLKKKADILLNAIGENSLLVSGVDQLYPDLQQRLAAIGNGQHPGHSSATATGSPMLWALLLARHLPIGMEDAGTVLPDGWPKWSADPHVIGFCQTTVVVIGWVGAVILSRRLLELDRWAWVMGSMVLLLVSLGGRWLVAL